VQAVVKREAGGLLHLLLGEYGDAGGRVVDAGQATVGGDGDGLLDDRLRLRLRAYARSREHTQRSDAEASR
jgi:hypothetical protein